MTCKVNEAVAFNGERFHRLVDEFNVTLLRADFTERNPDAEKLAGQLGNESNTLPFLAVIPANRPQQPMTLTGLLESPAPVIELITKAGPSRAATKGPASAEPQSSAAVN